MFMIMCVVDEPKMRDPVLQAWYKNGFTGITIIESTGIHRLAANLSIPMRYTFRDTDAERGNNTLLTVVEDEESIQRCLKITESVIGDFNEPNTGIFTAWPLYFAKGITGNKQD
jgi:hypothetical protein